MRITLLSAILLLSLHVCFGATAKPITTSATMAKQHPRFKERRGTMGFVYAVVLGPVGYFGVKLFSRRNEVMQYQAGRGFRLWGIVVASVVVLAACALLKDGDNFSDNVLGSLWASF
jgi:uncharacterized membrane protein YeaQ/YmgE (transglycosylase-associated protein family)